MVKVNVKIKGYVRVCGCVCVCESMHVCDGVFVCIVCMCMQAGERELDHLYLALVVVIK